MSVVLPITGKLRPDRENPPRFHWSFYAILVALFVYPNMASIAGAAIAMGLISLLLVTRYFIGKLP